MPTLDRRSAVVATLGLAVIVAISGLLLDRFFRDPAFVKPHDFLQYWAAGRQNATGGNPYDADQLLALQRGAVRDEDRPTFMWNPPWALALTMPFGLLPMRTGQLLWLLAQLAGVVWAAGAIWTVYGGDPRFRPLVWGGALLFYPVMYLVLLGQSGGWLLVGVAAFLVAATRGPAWLAAFTALAAVKPHLFLPLWLCLALDATRSRRSASLLGWGIAGGLGMILIATAVNPAVWGEYLAAITRPETDAHRPLAGWQHPLLGYRLRLTLDPAALWVQMLPTFAVLALVPMYWWLRRECWEWRTELPRLLFAGLIAAPYGAWEHDQLVLLVPVLAAWAALARDGNRTRVLIAAGVFLAINAAALTIRASQEFVWVPPALLVWYAGVSLAVRPVPTPAVSGA